MKHDTFLPLTLLFMLTSRCVGFEYFAQFNGSYTNFLANTVKNDTGVVDTLYQSCVETLDGSQSSTGAVCVSHLLAKMLQAIAQVSIDSRFVAIANQTTVYLNESASLHPPKASVNSRKARSDRKRSYNLDKLFKRRSATGQWPTNSLEMIDVVNSSIHTLDGTATRFNVRANNARLQVDRNQTHATARFESQAGSRVLPRDSVNTNGYSYRFAERITGIKVQAHGIDSIDQNLTSDINAFADAFALDIYPSSWFQMSNTWVYQVCGQKTQKPLFNGRIIAERIEPEDDYEGIRYERVKELSCGGST